MNNAMKKMMALLLALVMVLLASPFAVLAEGGITEPAETVVQESDGLIEETLTPVETETEESAETTPVVNVSNTVTAVNLLAAGDAVVEETAEGVVEPVAEGDQWTVTFNVGEANSTVDPITVADGGVISNLPVPTWTDENGAPLYAFDGWHTDEACENDFTNTTSVTENITVYAKWVGLDEEGKYYVNFYSQDGGTVHLTVAVDEGRTVNPATAPVVEGKVFSAWSTKLQDGADVSEVEPFDFSTAISDAAPDGKTLNLYAWYGDEVKVSFVANGGIAVPTQILMKGDTATEVTPTRTGYTFEGWSTSASEYVAFSFDTVITEDITLYAFWNADMVPVTLVYMYENANDDGYTPSGESDIVYAPAGSYLSIEKSAITNLYGEHSVRYADTVSGGLIGDASTAETNGSDAVIDDIRDTYYQYKSATNGRLVMPNGTTVMLVYYNRVRVTLTFTYTEGTTAEYQDGMYTLQGVGSIDVNANITADVQAKYDVDYDPTDEGFAYSFTAKYGQEISAVWPQVGWVADSENNFYGWDLPGGTDQVSNIFTLESKLFSDPTIGDNGVLVAVGDITAIGRTSNKVWLIYARTTLPGETADFTYNNNNYTIYKEACQLGNSATQYFGYKQLDGCTEANSNARWYVRNYSALGSSTSISHGSNSGGPGSSNIAPVYAASGTIADKFDSTFGEGKIADDDNCQILLYDRSTLTLNIWVYDETYGQNQQSAEYLYDDWIYNDDSDLLRTIEAERSKPNYRFAGWYTDPDFTEGTLYVPTEESRITANMNLYAKWEPTQFLAEYYLYTDDSSPYRTQGFAEGDLIDNKTVPVEVLDQFVGWYWYQNGELVFFDFNAAVGADHVDEDDVLKLYAKWRGTTGKVSYLPGEGGDNEEQKVADLKDYEIDQASVLLPDYDKVWTDGSVPSNNGLIFVGWKAPNGAIYQPGRYVLVTRTLMQFEAQWSADAVTLTYTANGGEGSDVVENWARNSVVSIWDNMNGTTPHFTREDYKLIGWDTDPNATEPTYSLGEGSIKLEADRTTLYAIWEKCTTNIVLGKVVDGNMGDWNKEFTFTVSYKDASGADVSKTVTLKHNAKETLTDIPIGATITVTETDTNYTEKWVTGTIEDSGMTASQLKTAIGGTDTTGLTATATVAATGTTIIFTNTNEATVDTGILLDSLPYVVILAAVGAALVLWFVRKRRVDD